MANEFSDDASDVMTVEQFAKKWKVGRGSAYEAIRRGEVPVIRIGRRILISKAALARILESGTNVG